MRVIGSGFGRTGTLSLKHALEELGFAPCYHMEEVLRRPSHVRAWSEYAAGKPVDWGELFDGFDAAVDFPASVVYRELLAEFPDAKVVHTVRDPDRWYDSTRETIYESRTVFPGWARRLIPPLHAFTEMVDAMIWDGLFDGRFEDRDIAITRYHEWTAEVVASVPPEQLLVFEVGDGWAPLCEFLGVLQPAGSFPHVNDRETMARRFTRARFALQVAPVVGGGLVAVLTALLVRRRRHRS